MRADADDPFDPGGSGHPEPTGFAVLLWSIIAAVALLLAVVALLYGVPDLNSDQAAFSRELDRRPTGSLGDGTEIEIMGSGTRTDRTAAYAGRDFVSELARLEVENAGLRQTVATMRNQMDILVERIDRVEQRFGELTGSVDPAPQARSAPPARPALPIIPDRDSRPVAEATPEPVRQTRFGVELGTYADLAAVRAEWRRLLNVQPELFGDLEAVATVRDRGGRTELLLVAGPFASASEAAERCATIETADLTCLPAFFLGQPLEIR